MLVVNDFLDENEENSILEEVEPYMQKLHYEFDHWDNVITLHFNFFFVCLKCS